MTDKDFESFIKAEKKEGDFYWADNVENLFNDIYNRLIDFINKINNILESDDETLKKALEFSLVCNDDLADHSNSLFNKHNYDLDVGESSIETLLYTAFEYVRKFDKKNREEYFLIPQREIEIGNKTYRVDFELINYLNNKKYVIECDGYKYHSSKEQMKNDYERQRDLENAGYTVIRFLGTEIFNDPINCVYEVYKRAELIELSD